MTLSPIIYIILYPIFYPTSFLLSCNPISYHKSYPISYPIFYPTFFPLSCNPISYHKSYPISYTLSYIQSYTLSYFLSYILSFISWFYLLSFILSFIIHKIFSLARDWSKRVTWVNISQLKLGNIRGYSPIFKTARVAKKVWRIINTIASIWGEDMPYRAARIFVLGHNLFLVAHSFPLATLSENCSPLGTDNVRGQIS